jgi:hypothetical protein
MNHGFAVNQRDQTKDIAHALCTNHVTPAIASGHAEFQLPLRDDDQVVQHLTSPRQDFAVAQINPARLGHQSVQQILARDAKPFDALKRFEPGPAVVTKQVSHGLPVGFIAKIGQILLIARRTLQST